MRGLYFDDFTEGRQFFSASRTVTESDVMTFAGVSGDFNPLHTDETFAEKTPMKTRIAHGMLTMAIATGLANQMGIFEGTTIALMQQTINYKGMVRFGDTVRLIMTVKNAKPSRNPKRGVVTYDVQIVNQKDEPVIDSEWVLMMARHEGAAEQAES
jgi:acyl dehydratase